MVVSALSHLEQLQDEVQGFRFLHQLIQVVVAEAVVGEHVGHTARVDVPVHWVFALCDAPHTLGHKRIDAGVLERREDPQSQSFYEAAPEFVSKRRHYNLFLLLS